MSIVRLFLLAEAVSLLIAALLHSGYLTGGRFDTAAYFESGIAVVLLIALGLGLLVPLTARWAALASQAFALAGASIGLYLATRGLAPNTTLDIVYHVALVAVIAWGLVVAWRARPVEAAG